MTAVDKVFAPGPGRIFVFGANRAGIHGAGAARTAHEQHGAVWGRGEGLCCYSYAIPTKDERVQSLALMEIAAHVSRFIAFARSKPELHFFVTRIGCGLAGFTDEQMAPMFAEAPGNCELPHGWAVKP